jgi:3-hexulose-6-phosphate synthase
LYFKPPDKAVKDDDFVVSWRCKKGVLSDFYWLPDNLALMGLRPGQTSAVPKLKEIGIMSVYRPMKIIVQISLDFTSISKALETARLAIRAGVDWLEAGTPLIISEGMNSIRTLRAEFPSVPIVADLKAMDGGSLEAQMAARAGATHVVVMERAHPETIKAMVQAAKDFGFKVMGDNLAAEDRVAAAKRLEDLGCDYVIHHIGYDERRGLAAMGKPYPSPLDQLREVVAAVKVPVQAVGGLSVEQAIRTPEFGARLVVLGAPLIEGGSSGDLENQLRLVCDRVHAYQHEAV